MYSSLKIGIKEKIKEISNKNNIVFKWKTFKNWNFRIVIWLL